MRIASARLAAGERLARSRFASLRQVRPRSSGSAKTAMASSPELADIRKQPSGVTETSTGAVPMPSGRSTERVRSTLSSAVSITAIRSWWVTAT